MWNKRKEGGVFVISAPSGAGKTTIIRRLLRMPSLNLRYSVSFTTREPRKGERPGRDYYFIPHKNFEKKIKKGDFLEYAKVYSHYYGTDGSIVRSIQKKGHNVLIDVDTQGALKLKARKGFRAVYIFILPPSIKELRKRLLDRKREGTSEINKRLNEASKEMKRSKHYDYCVINKSIDKAVEDAKTVIQAELLRSSRYHIG
jgi:guanylate kinase